MDNLPVEINVEMLEDLTPLASHFNDLITDQLILEAKRIATTLPKTDPEFLASLSYINPIHELWFKEDFPVDIDAQDLFQSTLCDLNWVNSSKVASRLVSTFYELSDYVKVMSDPGDKDFHEFNRNPTEENTLRVLTSFQSYLLWNIDYRENLKMLMRDIPLSNDYYQVIQNMIKDNDRWLDKLKLVNLYWNEFRELTRTDGDRKVYVTLFKEELEQLPTDSVKIVIPESVNIIKSDWIEDGPDVKDFSVKNIIGKTNYIIVDSEEFYSKYLTTHKSREFNHGHSFVAKNNLGRKTYFSISGENGSEYYLIAGLEVKGSSRSYKETRDLHRVMLNLANELLDLRNMKYSTEEVGFVKYSSELPMNAYSREFTPEIKDIVELDEVIVSHTKLFHQIFFEKLKDSTGKVHSLTKVSVYGGDKYQFSYLDIIFPLTERVYGEGSSSSVTYTYEGLSSTLFSIYRDLELKDLIGVSLEYAKILGDKTILKLLDHDLDYDWTNKYLRAVKDILDKVTLENVNNLDTLRPNYASELLARFMVKNLFLNYHTNYKSESQEHPCNTLRSNVLSNSSMDLENHRSVIHYEETIFRMDLIWLKESLTDLKDYLDPKPNVPVSIYNLELPEIEKLDFHVSLPNYSELDDIRTDLNIIESNIIDIDESLEPLIANRDYVHMGLLDVEHLSDYLFPYRDLELSKTGSSLVANVYTMKRRGSNFLGEIQWETLSTKSSKARGSNNVIYNMSALSQSLVGYCYGIFGEIANPRTGSSSPKSLVREGRYDCLRVNSFIHEPYFEDGYSKSTAVTNNQILAQIGGMIRQYGLFLDAFDIVKLTLGDIGTTNILGRAYDFKVLGLIYNLSQLLGTSKYSKNSKIEESLNPELLEVLTKEKDFTSLDLYFIIERTYNESKAIRDQEMMRLRNNFVDISETDSERVNDGLVRGTFNRYMTNIYERIQILTQIIAHLPEVFYQSEIYNCLDSPEDLTDSMINKILMKDKLLLMKCVSLLESVESAYVTLSELGTQYYNQNQFHLSTYGQFVDKRIPNPPTVKDYDDGSIHIDTPYEGKLTYRNYVRGKYPRSPIISRSHLVLNPFPTDGREFALVGGYSGSPNNTYVEEFLYQLKTRRDIKFIRQLLTDTEVYWDYTRTQESFKSMLDSRNSIAELTKERTSKDILDYTPLVTIDLRKLFYLNPEAKDILTSGYIIASTKFYGKEVHPKELLSTHLVNTGWGFILSEKIEEILRITNA